MAQPVASSSMRRPHPAEPAVMIGEYRRLNEIGKGSFAMVFRGVHSSKGALVAIKTVSLTKLNKKLKENLRSEVEILQELHHPHIVSLFDFRESTKHAHLVMEFCELGDLSTFIKKRLTLADHEATADMIRKYPNPKIGGLNEVVARHFLQQMASGLSWIRKRNFLHRDIKPQNLLLVPSPIWREAHEHERQPLMTDHQITEPPSGIQSLPLLKIADFGFARFLPSLQLADTLCGSPLYMAPEILRYEKYDAKADLWSTGTVLYEMLIGRPPFRANNHVELIAKIEKNNDRIRYPEGLQINADLKGVIEGLLKMKPTERLSYDNFFAHPAVKASIPNLHPEDLPIQKQSILKEESPSRKGSEAFSNPQSRRGSASATRPVEKRSSFSSSAIPKTTNERRPSLHGHSPSAPTRQQLLQTKDETPRAKVDREKTLSAIREKATQDIAFENEYVVVDKHAVHVNAIADEIGNNSNVKPNQIVPRRTVSTNTPYSTTAPQTSTRPWPVGKSHTRTTSLEQQLYSRSPVSASSAITKALNIANLRIWGFGTSPPTNMSPPLSYNPFPNYPNPSGSGFLIGDGSIKAMDSKDEDMRIAVLLEKLASRCDVVCSFAEVKYQQLAPVRPVDMPGIPEEPDDDDGLTAETIVIISEEAIVLYVQALELLTKIFDIVNNWFYQKKNPKNDGSPRSVPVRPGVSVDSKINNVVQWCRGKFNDCLEKSEFVGRKLGEGQKKLPHDHPGHPSNHFSASNSSITAKIGASAENIELTTGVTAAKLMYERALEMSTATAINELTNTDLEGGEVNYRTVMQMLEAILDDGQYDVAGRKIVRKDDDVITGLEAGTRAEVSAVLEGVKQRHRELKQRIRSQKMTRRLSAQQHVITPTASRQSPSSTTSYFGRGVSPRRN